VVDTANQQILHQYQVQVDFHAELMVEQEASKQ
jgi:hypothetical protein